jgi:hypothetical protein
MVRDLRELFRDAFELPEGERATHAGLLIESLEPPPDLDVEEAWAEVRAKLFRRGSWLALAGKGRIRRQDRCLTHFSGQPIELLGRDRVVWKRESMR